MTNPEYIGPRPIDELSIEEFARAEITHILTAPDEITTMGQESAASPAGLTYLENRKIFYAAAGDDPNDHSALRTERGISSLTAGALGRVPTLLSDVTHELGAAIPVNLPVFDSVVERTHVLRSLEGLRLQKLNEKTARVRLQERMRKAGLAAEPVHPYNFDELSAVTQNDQGYWIAHLDYEGTPRFGK